MDKLEQIIGKVSQWCGLIWKKTCRLWERRAEFRFDRKYFVWFFVPLLIPVIIIFISIAVIPVTTINTSRSEIENSDTSGVRKHHITKEERLEYANTHKLRYENAYMKARLEMVKGDSVNLVLNLTDSIIGLEIKGVIVFEVRLESYHLSRGFRKKDQDTLLAMLSTPYTMESRFASIPVHPVVIKEAPKDTVEANQAPSELPAPVEKDVYCTMLFDKELTLFLRQSDPNSGFNKKDIRRYYRQQRRLVFKHVAWSLVHFRRPSYRFWISVSVSKDDARSIYRALPERARMSLLIRPGR